MNVTQAATGQLVLEWSGTATLTYDIYIDDTPYFRQSIFHQTLNVTSLTLDPTDTGLATGVNYYARVVQEDNANTAGTTFRLNVESWNEPAFSYAYAKESWQHSGRVWMEPTCGVAWDSSKPGWKVIEPWSDEYTNVAQDAYGSSYATLAAVHMAALHHDLALLDELASFYIAYENRYTTIGAMRAMTQYDTSLLSGPDSTKTLLWVENAGTATYIRECDLCNSQFYYPVASLLRIITTLDAAEITPAMQSFVQWYAPVLTNDHLLRLLFRNSAAEMNRIQNVPGGLADEELWLIAEAAELLGAQASAPEEITLTDEQISQLKNAVQVTVQTLQTQYRTIYPNTQNFQGQTVGSTSYFNGEYVYVDLSSYAYSGYTGQSFPATNQTAYQPNASWDFSHLYRVPVFFRALFDNKKATGINFPSRQDMQGLANQLVYKTFQGNYDLPLFNNYFDGSNGWYRVGYDGASFGYPPAEYCNSFAQVGNYTLACLNAGGVQGWGLLSFVNEDLAELEHSLGKLALSQDATQTSFRTRYYYYWNQDFSMQDAQSNAQYPIMLFFVLAATADRLQ